MSGNVAALRVARRLARRIGVALYGPRRVRVVVLGHQKSGTTAVGALLAGALKVDFANDPLYRIDWGRARVVRSLVNDAADLSECVNTNRSLFCSVVVKDPDLSFLVEDCARVFPKASIVHVVRDPRDTIRSIADRLDLTPEDLGRATVSRSDFTPHWQLILDGNLPALEGATVAARLAQRWRRAWALTQAYEGPVTVLRYEDFRQDKTQAIGKLAEGLHLKVRADISSQVDVPFQPSGRPAVKLDERLGEDNLRQIESLCQSEMDELGYARG